MAKISTRPQEDAVDTVVIKQLQEILDDATDGVVSTKSSARLPAATDIDGLVVQLRGVIGAMNAAASRMYNDLHILSNDNTGLRMALDEALEMLSDVADVQYDEALDHSTADLMDAFCGSGAANVTDDGDLEFDERITFSKADLKPILREAILRYLSCKLS
jgi:hypothetical protein